MTGDLMAQARKIVGGNITATHLTADPSTLAILDARVHKNGEVIFIKSNMYRKLQ